MPTQTRQSGNTLRITVPQFGAMIDIHRATAYEMAASGKLPVPVHRAGRLMFIARRDVEALLGADHVARFLEEDSDEGASAA